MEKTTVNNNGEIINTGYYVDDEGFIVEYSVCYDSYDEYLTEKYGVDETPEEPF